MFLRREGSDDAAPAVAFGSHLDTVPTGGRFDGVFGVLAGLEVIRALDEAGIVTRAPLELVNWTNEEGSRFRPAMMGSRVHAADMALEDALAITDDKGISVREALQASGQAGAADAVPARLGLLAGGAYRAGSGDGGDRRRYRHRHRHHACALFPAHRHRRTEPCRPDHDGPPARQPGRDGGDHPGGGAHRAAPPSRAAAPRRPGSRTTPTRAATSPTSPACIATCGTSRRSGPSRWRRNCGRRWMTSRSAARVAIAVDPYATFGPISFDHGLATCCATRRRRASSPTRDMIAAAGHDSVLIAPLCPSAMLFVPSVGGITHNPREYSTREQLARGAQVMLDAVLELAG